LNNAVNDLGNSNFFDDIQDIDSEIGRLASSSSPLNGDELARIPQPIDSGDLAAPAEGSVDLSRSIPLQPPVGKDLPWHSIAARQTDLGAMPSDRQSDPDCQWRRDALEPLSAAPAPDLVTSMDAALSQAISHDPRPCDSPISDVNAELDLLLGALQLATPQPPPLASPVTANNSITNIQSRISTVEPVTHAQQLLQELNDARQQLTTAQTLLQLLSRRNQAQVDRVDANTQAVKQIKFHIQQLAQYSKSQVKTVRESIDAFDLIRTEIVATLDKVGGYEQIGGLGVQIATAHQNLLTARDLLTETLHDRVTIDRAALDESLRALQREVTARSEDWAAKLRQQQESVESLARSIATDRLPTVELNAKLIDIDDLGVRLTTMHDRVVETSQTLQSKISQIERGFGELSQSIQSEKEQFYELTVETIEKADLLRSQLTQMANQIEDDRVTISQLQADIFSIHQSIPMQIDRQLDSVLDARDRQLLAICDDLQARHHQEVATIKKLSTWLWILSVAVGTISILSICIAVSFKRAALF
jgi:hypothetical protein